jgi:threonyl-tRNA synthetase
VRSTQSLLPPAPAPPPILLSSPPAPPSLLSSGREKTRLTKESGARVDGADGSSTKIGGAFKVAENPPFLKDRAAVFEAVVAAQRARLAAKPRVPIKITLPDGKVLEGTSWETTPLSIAEGISKGLAGSVVVAKVS